MKNLRLVLFFAVMILSIPLMAQTPEVMTEVKVGLMAKVWAWFLSQGQGFIGGLVFAFAAKQGWTLIIKKVANKGAMITKELGELLTDSSVLLSVVDKSIKDDGTLKENSVAEMIAAGKDVQAELKDVIISIKPK